MANLAISEQGKVLKQIIYGVGGIFNRWNAKMVYWLEPRRNLGVLRLLVTSNMSYICIPVGIYHFESEIFGKARLVIHLTRDKVDYYLNLYGFEF